MSQSAYTIANGDGATFRAALNTVLAAIQSANSGSSAPSSTVAYMLWADTANGVLKQRDAGNTAWVTLGPLSAPVVPPGTLAPTGRRSAPTGYLMCFGQAVNRTTYADLYSAICPTLGTFTVTIASPGVLTLVGNDLQIGERVRLTTNGALPTGLATGTDYFVATKPATDTFTLSATQGGAAINTSGTQSGVHTIQSFAHGAGDGSTTFNLPDLRGRVPLGADAMGGTAASRVTSGGSGVYGAALGANGGAETHTLTSAQIPAHAHPLNGGNSYSLVRTSGGAVGLTSGTGLADTVTNTSNNTGGGNAHNNMQPVVVTNWMIKT